MARGRVKFYRYKPVLMFMSRLYAILPMGVRVGLLAAHRHTLGNAGIAIRYALLKSIAEECGDNVVIREGVYFSNPQNLHVGNHVSFNPMSYIECGKDKEAGLCIGNDVSIGHGATIMSIEHIHVNPNLCVKDQSIETKHVEIGSNVLIGAKSSVLPGVRIGAGVYVGCNSVVTKDIPNNKICVGAPARPIKDLFE